MKSSGTAGVRIALTLVAVLLGASAFSASFTNGSFEEPTLEAIEDYASRTDQKITGWTVVGPGLVTRLKGNARVGGPDPADGNQQICFNGGSGKPGMQIFQMFDTTSTNPYTLSFKVGRRGSDPGTAGIQAEISDALTGKRIICIGHFSSSRSI